MMKRRKRISLNPKITDDHIRQIACKNRMTHVATVGDELRNYLEHEKEISQYVRDMISRSICEQIRKDIYQKVDFEYEKPNPFETRYIGHLWVFNEDELLEFVDKIIAWASAPKPTFSDYQEPEDKLQR